MAQRKFDGELRQTRQVMNEPRGVIHAREETVKLIGGPVVELSIPRRRRRNTLQQLFHSRAIAVTIPVRGGTDFNSSFGHFFGSRMKIALAVSSLARRATVSA